MAMTLTKGECLLIGRRRARKNQTQMAKEFGVHRDTYSQWEKDMTGTAPDFTLDSPVKPNEMCYLMRRRSGKTQKQLGQELHLSRVTINLMELGKTASTALTTYWGI